MKIIWVLVNCNTVKEATDIGNKSLEERSAACFDIFPRLLARYFWPPKSGKIETAKGCLLVIETLPKNFKKTERIVKKMHSDELPFIGSINIDNVGARYMKWLRGETG